MKQETFLQDVINNLELRRSLALEAFLILPNYEEFVQKSKDLDRKMNKKNIRVLISKRNIENENKELFKLKNLQTVQGKAYLKISGNLKNFYHTFLEYLNNEEQLMER